MKDTCGNCRYCARQIGKDRKPIKVCIAFNVEVDPDSGWCKWWTGFEREVKDNADIECASDC